MNGKNDPEDNEDIPINKFRVILKILLDSRSMEDESVTELLKMCDKLKTTLWKAGNTMRSR